MSQADIGTQPWSQPRWIDDVSLFPPTAPASPRMDAAVEELVDAIAELGDNDVATQQSVMADLQAAIAASNFAARLAPLVSTDHRSSAPPPPIVTHSYPIVSVTYRDPSVVDSSDPDRVIRWAPGGGKREGPHGVPLVHVPASLVARVARGPPVASDVNEFFRLHGYPGGVDDVKVKGVSGVSGPAFIDMTVPNVIDSIDLTGPNVIDVIDLTADEPEPEQSFDEWWATLPYHPTRNPYPGTSL